MKKRIIKKSHNMYIKNAQAYTYEGESIEKKVDRILDSKEPISDGAPIIYTEKKDGVLPQFDIRTDKWELAQEAMDKANKAKIAQGKSPSGEIEQPQTAADATKEIAAIRVHQNDIWFSIKRAYFGTLVHIYIKLNNFAFF